MFLATYRYLVDLAVQAIYHKWALDNGFESKLPEDVDKRKKVLLKVIADQQTLDAHLQDIPKKKNIIAYSRLTFHCAAIEWLILTDQVCLIHWFLFMDTKVHLYTSCLVL